MLKMKHIHVFFNTCIDFNMLCAHMYMYAYADKSEQCEIHPYDSDVHKNFRLTFQAQAHALQ